MGWGTGGGIDYSFGGLDQFKPAAPGSTLLQGLPAINQSVPSIPNPSGGGVLGGISSALGAGIPIVGQVGAILQGINGIASLFKTSPQGQAKEAATANQQDMEKWMRSIEKQVNDGTMSVDAGMQAIAVIMQSAAMGDQVGGGAGAAGANAVRAMGSQIMSNLAQKRDWQLQGGVKDPGAMDRIMSGNLPGGEQFQKSRIATLGRNALLGTQLGKDLKDVGSPIGNIGNMGPMYGGEVNKTLAALPGQYAKLNPGVGQAGDVLKKKLGVYGGV